MRVAATLLVTALVAIVPRASKAQVAAEGTAQATFTVVKVDRATGTLVLAEPEVGTLEMRAGPAVPLAHLRRGQQLKVTYYPEVALALERRGSSTSKPSRIRPTGVAARQPSMTEPVVAIDTLGHTVTVRAHSGWTQVIRVTDPRLDADIEGVRSGEGLQLTYTQALAVAAKPSD
jgi:hypothetical protein